MERRYELARTPDGRVARVRLRGSPVRSSLRYRGTACTLPERAALGLPAASLG